MKRLRSSTSFFDAFRCDTLTFGSLVRTVLLAVCACLLAACGDEAPENTPSATAPRAGTFEAQARGALQAALEGEATARLDSVGRLAGLEFDDAEDTTRAGLSFELAARRGRLAHTYTVTPRDQGGREDTTFSLMNAYLRLRSHEFAARAGSLRVERDAEGVLSGTFGLRLRGSIDAASDEAATVTASGRFENVQPGS